MSLEATPALNFLIPSTNNTSLGPDKMCVNKFDNEPLRYLFIYLFVYFLTTLYLTLYVMKGYDKSGL